MRRIERIIMILTLLGGLGCQGVEPCSLVHHDLTHTPSDEHVGAEELQEGLRPTHGVYVAQISIGTPPQTFEAIVDTGSANFIVTGPDCSGCDTVDYEPGSSSTAKATGSDISVIYGSGALKATAYQDLAGLPCGDLTEVTFGVATESNHVGSILGLGYATLATDGATPWLDSMVSAGVLDDIFSMRLCGVGKSGSHIKLGGLDLTIDASALVYTPIIQESYYVITAPSVSVSGEDLGTTAPSTTIVDSGTTLMLVPATVHAGIQTELAKAAAAAGLESKLPEGFWGTNATDISKRVDFSSEEIAAFPPVTLSLPNEDGSGTITLEIKPQTYFRAATGGYYFGIRPAAGLAILGQVFMENYDVVFDRANKRLGFSPISGCSD